MLERNIYTRYNYTMDKIDELLTRGVGDIIPDRKELEKILRSGKKLTLYQGFDPTGTDLHIGHMIGLRKLAQWQKLGHKVIFLIGDGTGQAGDPSGKLSAREKFFTIEELRKNAKDYVMQASKLLNFDGENAIEILYNGDWLNKLKLSDLLDIAGHFTLQQLSERDMFQERIKRNEPVNLREFLYPILQGYDSVAMGVDLEVGGSDQTFNMLCGRTLLKQMAGKDKFVMSTPLLEDSQGRKIGKSEGNVIGMVDKAEDLFGKIMSLGDSVIAKGLEYLTDVTIAKIQQIEKSIQAGENPLEYKKLLAFEIVKQLNDEKSAQLAQENFEKVVQRKELPKDVPTVKISMKENITIADVLVEIGFAQSKSDAKRQVAQGGVKIDNEVINNALLPFPEIKDSEDKTLLQSGRKILYISVQ